MLKTKDLIKRYERNLSHPHITFSLDLKFNLDEYCWTKGDKEFHTFSEIVLSLYHFSFYSGSDRRIPTLQDVHFILEIASTHPLSPFLTEAKPDPESGLYRDKNGYKAPFLHVYNLIRSDTFAEVVEKAKKVADQELGLEIKPAGAPKPVKTMAKRSLSSAVPDTPVKRPKKKASPKAISPPSSVALPPLLETKTSEDGDADVDVASDLEEDLGFGTQSLE